MQIHIKLRNFRDFDDLEAKVRRWELLGVSGIVVSDHLYTGRAAAVDAGAEQRHDPYVVLSTVGVLSRGLTLSVLVSNVSYQHPVFILRQASELAYLFGGWRVTAGLGAGWNAEEFSSLGLAMPAYADRMARLAEAAAAARQLFDTGIATVSGEQVRLNRLPLNPRAPVPPKLAIGGGSVSAMDIAARFADHFDFDAPSHSMPLTRGLDGATARSRDVSRRLLTTDADLRESRRLLSAALAGAGRQETDLSTSINVSAVQVGAEGDRSALVAFLSRLYAVADASLVARDVSHCPFVLLGTVNWIGERLTQLGDELALDQIVLPDSPGTEAVLRHLSCR